MKENLGGTPIQNPKSKIQNSPRRCPDCGREYPPQTLVCIDCRQPLIAPEGRKKTPGALIAMLIVIIIGLLSVAAYLAWKILYLREF
ncbi:MAG: hypothetical protein ACYC7E_13080 [Armatimonadota bacterium]